MRDVLFVRTPIEKAQDVSLILHNFYLAGWRVRSHTVDHNEYSFVLEGPKRRNPTLAELNKRYTYPYPANETKR